MRQTKPLVERKGRKMKRISKLLGFLPVLCLLLPLSGAPAFAQSAYQEEFAATGGWPPETIGSWAGYWKGLWGMYTFYPNGRYDLTLFSNPYFNSTGTSKNLEPEPIQSIEGDVMHLSDGEIKGDLHRISMPYVRLNEEKETAAAGMDPALMGTFGGKMSDTYIEWTFHGDGRFTQVTPTEELRENGTYFTGGGELAIFLNGKLSKYSYSAANHNYLIVYPSPDSRIALSKRTGPLVQVPMQWQIDTGESAEPAYQEEFAQTGGWPPENIGSWVGIHFMNLCGQFSFYPNGRYDMTVLQQSSYNRTGTSKTLEKADKAVAEGDILHIEDNGSKDDARRVSMPYVRLIEDKETAAPGIDPAVIGTFSGRRKDIYMEWTFHGDGRFTQVNPYLESTEHGTFITGGGELAILLNGKISKYPYRMRNDFLVVYLSEDNRMAFTKRTGPLVQVPMQWAINVEVP